MSRVFEAEVECDGPHCDDIDCECEAVETVTSITSEEMNRLWMEHHPEGESSYPSGWERTDVEPWRSMAEIIFKAEAQQDKLSSQYRLQR